MLRGEVVGALVPYRPALRRLSELVVGEHLGHPHQIGISLHGIGAGLASGLSELCCVREADLSVSKSRACHGQLSELSLGAHIAGGIGTGPPADLVQQSCAAVAVALALCDRRSSFGLEQLDTRAQRLREPEHASQLAGGGRFDAVEGRCEAFERLLHLREHTFTLPGRCETSTFICLVDDYNYITDIFR